MNETTQSAIVQKQLELRHKLVADVIRDGKMHTGHGQSHFIFTQFIQNQTFRIYQLFVAIRAIRLVFDVCHQPQPIGNIDSVIYEF